jgi:hypothetical protein
VREVLELVACPNWVMEPQGVRPFEWQSDLTEFQRWLRQKILRPNQVEHVDLASVTDPKTR